MHCVAAMVWSTEPRVHMYEPEAKGYCIALITGSFNLPVKFLSYLADPG